MDKILMLSCISHSSSISSVKKLKKAKSEIKCDQWTGLCSFKTKVFYNSNEQAESLESV